jgi:hypothetical protein
MAPVNRCIAALIVLVLLSGCASGSSHASSGLPAGWTQHTVKSGGFSIALPPGWHLKTVPSGRFTAVDTADPSAHAAMDVTPTTEAGDILAFLNAVTADQQAIEQGQRTTVARQRSDLPAGRAEKLTYSYMAQTSGGLALLTFVEYIVFKPRPLKASVFHLTFVSVAARAGAFGPTFAQMASTFQVQ